tara:strand:- start:116 stop:1126 length:1011 start_codon:yes stop_codon:yes gene_type:complete
VGSSVGIGALIMGVTLLSVFAIATSVISNQTEVALDITNPNVIDKPKLSLSNIGNSGTVGGLNIASPGIGYYPGNLVFTGDCNQQPSGTYTVSSERWVTDNFPDENTVDYDGEAISFLELDDVFGATTEWYVWYSVDLSGNDPNLAGTGIVVEISSGDSGSEIRDSTLDALDGEPLLTEINFQSGAPADTIIADYSNSGPVTDTTTTGVLSVVTQTQGGSIIGTSLDDSGSGCNSIPTITITPNAPGGSTGSVIVGSMVWDFTYEITNDGDDSVKLADIFITIDGGPTEVLSSTPAFTTEYLFPGETISVLDDENSATEVGRVAISSHGMNIAVET